jgi:hypothetical protein
MCWGSYSTFLTSNSKHPQKVCLLEPNLIYLMVWWFQIGAPVEFSGPPRWGANSTFKASNSKHLRKNLALRAKSAKFRYLVIWNWGPGGIMRPPLCWGSNSTFKTSNSKHLNFFWLLQQKRLNLDIWWFEIGALVELWGPPRIEGPIPPSKPQIQNT